MNDNMKLKGLVTLVLTDESGNVKQTHIENLVVTTGVQYVISRMKDATAAVVSHCAVGTGVTAAAAAQTALVTESARIALTSTNIVTTTVTNDAIQYVTTFNPGVATVAITEAGLFNAASVGTMVARTMFSAINKAIGDTLTVTWKITLAAV